MGIFFFLNRRNGELSAIRKVEEKKTNATHAHTHLFTKRIFTFQHKTVFPVNFLTYILSAFLVHSLPTLSSLLADHNALQQGVNYRHSKGVIKRHNLHLQ